MKTIKYEVKLERSVKVILCLLVLGLFLNVFSTPIAKELLGTKDALARSYEYNKIWLMNWPELE
jgi:hypothetical protein